jgi:hypothetical protein
VIPKGTRVRGFATWAQDNVGTIRERVYDRCRSSAAAFARSGSRSNVPAGDYQPIEKPGRVHDAKALAAARRRFCEFCGRTPVDPAEIHVHHISAKGNGVGPGDVGGPDGNLISLCWQHHDDAHWGRISRERLRAIIAMRP